MRASNSERNAGASTVGSGKEYLQVLLVIRTRTCNGVITIGKALATTDGKWGTVRYEQAILNTYHVKGVVVMSNMVWIVSTAFQISASSFPRPGQEEVIHSIA